LFLLKKTVHLVADQDKAKDEVAAFSAASNDARTRAVVLPEPLTERRPAHQPAFNPGEYSS